MLTGNSEFYSHSLKLWEGMEQDLNFNTMMSQRGQIVLFHLDGQREAAARRANAMLNRDDYAEILSATEVRKRVPYLDLKMSGFPYVVGFCSVAQVPRGMMLWHGVLRAGLISVVWIWSRTAKLLALMLKTEKSQACRPRKGR